MAFKYKEKYGNYINGKFVDPIDGQFFDNITPINGKVLCKIARSNEKDINSALDAAHAAKDDWGKTSVTERSNMLIQIAQIIEDNLPMLAEAETWDNGKVLEKLQLLIYPWVRSFRYFASVIRAQEGTLAELNDDTVSYLIPEPLGVVGQIIP